MVQEVEGTTEDEANDESMCDAGLCSRRLAFKLPLKKAIEHSKQKGGVTSSAFLKSN